MARYEQRFGGKDNAGLRKLIRKIVRDFDAGETEGTGWSSRGEAVLKAVPTSVSLTAAGQFTLEQVAADYDAVQPSRATP
jgi:hypothetical protein